ncbi:uncharacterized protein FIESC28_02863 [Fusarium coffeatum]|uniref:Zn(2)-C6 fungal-type domain-containing protein n=1 Tax=Fusarium coffeatum TaxID=231269 RepID=A0A366S4X7_9HYPO|nr:uncharacterized protein FIESC28_02863 [Fusarium coffeatum]RBR24373.1 hypothetical protein FIESC28_02863 [Fusarium coffeatum]
MGDHISLAPEPAPKRRKLRKGTQSCWECKRRKAKCIFSDNLGICDSCKRRGTDCVSQDTDENPPPLGSNKHLVDRLGEVEALVQHLLKAQSSERRSDDRLSPESVGSGGRSHDEDRRRSDSSPAFLTESVVDAHENGVTTDVVVTNITPRSEDSIPSGAAEGHDDLYTELVAAWPGPEDMAVILGLPVEPSQIIRALTCAPPKDRTSGFPSPANLLRLPPRGSHPVLVARKMLVLATYLQGVPIVSEKHLDKLSTSYESIMARLVKVAHNKVTCDDDLVSSLEGIECIMLEGLYANYSGDLRRSWLAARRAMTMAQMMGLNRGIAPLSFRGATVDVSDLWFRILNFDRYLCLMLGLPQSSPDEPLPRIDDLESHPANRKLQILCSVACAKLLNRKTADLYNTDVTKDIDKILRDACTSMPAQWWIPPTLASHSELPDRIRETLRFNDHFMQYHLLLALHMPYILKIDGDESCGYHKLTAITTSREILTRFISIRTLPQTKTYCRGTDLIAFMASTTLTLGHILCDHRHKRIEDHGYHFLTQQRLSDRGLLEQVLSIAETSMHRFEDEISKRLTTLLHYLLAMEDNVTAGVRYHVTFSEETKRDAELGNHVKASDDSTVLEIHLPHCPVIKILRRDPEGKEALPVVMEVPWGQTPATGTSAVRTVNTVEPVSASEVMSSGINVSGMSPLLSDNPVGDTWTLEGLDMSFLDNFIEGPAVI